MTPTHDAIGQSQIHMGPPPTALGPPPTPHGLVHLVYPRPNILASRRLVFD